MTTMTYPRLMAMVAVFFLVSGCDEMSPEMLAAKEKQNGVLEEAASRYRSTNSALLESIKVMEASAVVITWAVDDDRVRSGEAPISIPSLCHSMRDKLDYGSVRIEHWFRGGAKPYYKVLCRKPRSG